MPPGCEATVGAGGAWPEAKGAEADAQAARETAGPNTVPPPARNPEVLVPIEPEVPTP
jgi:hypothetical protein